VRVAFGLSRLRIACLGIRFSVGCALIIPVRPGTLLLALASDSVGWPLIIRLIIQTILLYPSRAVSTDGPSNVSRLDPSGADQIDAEHPTRNRKVVGSMKSREQADGSRPGRRDSCVLSQPSRVTGCSSSAAADPGRARGRHVHPPGSSSARGFVRLAEYEDVFVGDDPQRESVGAGLADLVQLEEGGSGDEPVLA